VRVVRRRVPVALVVAGTLAVVAAGCGGRGFELGVGDCLTVDGPTDAVTGRGEVTIVDCDEPHDLEVFHTFDLGADELEGDARVTAVTAACLGPAFESYVGEPAATSTLPVFPLPPTPDDVAAGVTEVACTIGDPDDGPTTGSVGDRPAEPAEPTAVTD
jgi:hypothetical protein